MTLRTALLGPPKNYRLDGQDPTAVAAAARAALADLKRTHPGWHVPPAVAVPRAEFTTTMATLEDTTAGAALRITRAAADGIIVSGTAVAAGVTVADCLAICLWTGERLAVLHGARACLAPPDGSPGIIAEALRAGAFDQKTTRAWIGAGIGPCCYGLDRVPKEIPAYAVRRPTRGPRKDKPVSVDLRALAAGQLRAGGIQVAQITIDARCTSCVRSRDTHPYWSHVRGDPERNVFVAWLDA